MRHSLRAASNAISGPLLFRVAKLFVQITRPCPPFLGGTQMRLFRLWVFKHVINRPNPAPVTIRHVLSKPLKGCVLTEFTSVSRASRKANRSVGQVRAKSPAQEWNALHRSPSKARRALHRSTRSQCSRETSRKFAPKTALASPVP